jgi:chorismate mutase
MQVYVTVIVTPEDTLARTASELAAEIQTLLTLGPEDTVQVSVTSTAGVAATPPA